MSTASDIIDALGKSAEVSRKTGIPLTTIESWKAANFIPEWRQATLLVLRGPNGERIKQEDFPPKEARVSRPQADAA